MKTEADERDEQRRRDFAAALYRPETARLIIVGEAPPPVRFFFYGDSLFFRFLRTAFINVVPEIETRDAGWFLAFFRAMGGWRVDVCPTPQRESKGGADEASVENAAESFLERWNTQTRHEDAVLVVSPKRLAPLLPELVRNEITQTVPPPGQWNAHRQAFLRDMAHVLTRHFGQNELRKVAQRVDIDDARLDFELACACAEGVEEAELLRLVSGHERENELRAAWNPCDGAPAQRTPN